jgi:predicted phage tail protein
MVISVMIDAPFKSLSFYSYALNNLPEGEYELRVAAVSIAQQGSFTNWHVFKVVGPTEEVPVGTITLGIFFVLTLVVGASISYYYKHRIITALRRRNDTVYLMNEIEPTDFHEVSIHHNDDRLSDIYEMENE